MLCVVVCVERLAGRRFEVKTSAAVFKLKTAGPEVAFWRTINFFGEGTGCDLSTSVAPFLMQTTDGVAEGVSR